MTHYHVERVRKTGMSEFTERVGAAWVHADRGNMLTPSEVTVRVSEPCHCPTPLEPESVSRLLNSLHERVQAIETRQRAAGIHDPDCDAAVREGFDNLLPRFCNCWLSAEANQGPQ